MKEYSANAKMLVDTILSTDSSAEDFEREFFRSFPRTHENISAFKRLSLRFFERDDLRGKIFGVCLKRKDISVAQVLYALEGLEDIPSEIKKKLPSRFAKKDWEALMRAAVLIMNGLETHIYASDLDWKEVSSAGQSNTI